MVGVAVKVTNVPRQKGFDEAETETLTGSSGLAITVIVFEVAGLF